MWVFLFICLVLKVLGTIIKDIIIIRNMKEGDGLASTITFILWNLCDVIIVLGLLLGTMYI